MEEDFIKMKHGSHSKKKYAGIRPKDTSLGTSYPAITSNCKQESSEIDSLIKQFREMKILFTEAVTEVDRLEQSKNNCKIVKALLILLSIVTNLWGYLDIYIFWKCLNYNIAGNRSNPSIPVANTSNWSDTIVINDSPEEPVDAMAGDRAPAEAMAEG